MIPTPTAIHLTSHPEPRLLARIVSPEHGPYSSRKHMSNRGSGWAQHGQTQHYDPTSQTCHTKVLQRSDQCALRPLLVGHLRNRNRIQDRQTSITFRYFVLLHPLIGSHSFKIHVRPGRKEHRAADDIVSMDLSTVANLLLFAQGCSCYAAVVSPELTSASLHSPSPSRS